MALCIFLLFAAIEIASCYNGYSSQYENSGSYYQNHKYCDDLSPYYGETIHGDIDLEQIAGVWYGVEKIPHSKGEYRIEHTGNCFYIDIKELYIQPTPPTPYPPATNSPYLSRSYGQPEHHRIRHFVVEWHEGLYRNDYHVKVNTSHKGFWPTDVPNHSVEYQYRFFGGVIQVLKAAHNHLVLNFCMRLPNSQLYSVVLSRNENQLTPEDLASIHNIFTMKHLSTSALQRVCENSAAQITMSGFVIFISFALIWKQLKLLG